MDLTLIHYNEESVRRSRPTSDGSLLVSCRSIFPEYKPVAVSEIPSTGTSQVVSLCSTDGDHNVLVLDEPAVARRALVEHRRLSWYHNLSPLSQRKDRTLSSCSSSSSSFAASSLNVESNNRSAYDDDDDLINKANLATLLRDAVAVQSSPHILAILHPNDLIVFAAQRIVTTDTINRNVHDNDNDNDNNNNNNDNDANRISDIIKKYVFPQRTMTIFPTNNVSIRFVITQLAAGNNHLLALTELGQAFSMGSGEYGQLGVGKRIAWFDEFLHLLLVPPQSSLATSTKSTSSSHRHHVTQASADSNSSGSSSGTATPTTGAGAAVVHYIAAGHNYSALIASFPRHNTDTGSNNNPNSPSGRQRAGKVTKEATSSRRLYTFGSGIYYRLGHGTTEDCLEPTLVSRLLEEEDPVGDVEVLNEDIYETVASFTGLCGGIERVALGTWHMVAVTCGMNDVYTWGWNKFGQANPDTEHNELIKFPTRVTALDDEKYVGDSDISLVTCGSRHTAIVTQQRTRVVVMGQLSLEYEPAYVPHRREERSFSTTCDDMDRESVDSCQRRPHEHISVVYDANWCFPAAAAQVQRSHSSMNKDSNLRKIIELQMPRQQQQQQHVQQPSETTKRKRLSNDYGDNYIDAAAADDDDDDDNVDSRTSNRDKRLRSDIDDTQTSKLLVAAGQQRQVLDIYSWQWNLLILV